MFSWQSPMFGASIILGISYYTIYSSMKIKDVYILGDEDNNILA